MRLKELQQAEGWVLPRIEEKRMVSRDVKDEYEEAFGECKAVIERIEARNASDEYWELVRNGLV